MITWLSSIMVWQVSFKWFAFKGLSQGFEVRFSIQGIVRNLTALGMVSRIKSESIHYNILYNSLQRLHWNCHFANWRFITFTFHLQIGNCQRKSCSFWKYCSNTYQAPRSKLIWPLFMIIKWLWIIFVI